MGVVSHPSWDDKAVSVVPHFAPGQLREWLAGKQRNANRGEFDAHTNFLAAFAKFSWEGELVAAEAAIYMLHTRDQMLAGWTPPVSLPSLALATKTSALWLGNR